MMRSEIECDKGVAAWARDRFSLNRPMSAMGQSRTWRYVRAISALPLKADIRQRGRQVRSVPEAEIEREVGRYHPAFAPLDDWATTFRFRPIDRRRASPE